MNLKHLKAPSNILYGLICIPQLHQGLSLLFTDGILVLACLLPIHGLPARVSMGTGKGIAKRSKSVAKGSYLG